MQTGRFEQRLLSPPCKVVFAGWESTTTALQQAGWQLSAEQDLTYGRVRLALRFEPARLYMMSETADHDFFIHARGVGPGNWGYEGRHLPVFHVRHCASDFRISMMESAMNFQAIDAMPQFTSVSEKSIEDFKLFATPLARTEEIIVEPATVASLLEQIRSIQSPELAAIRERNRKRDRRGEMLAPLQQQQTFHAQILSFAA